MEDSNKSIGNNNSILNDSRATNSHNATNSNNVDNHSVDNHSIDNHSVDSHDTHVINHHGVSLDEALKAIEQERQKAKEEAKRELENELRLKEEALRLERDKFLNMQDANASASQERPYYDMSLVEPLPGSEQYQSNNQKNEIPPQPTNSHPTSPSSQKSMMSYVIVGALVIAGIFFFVYNNSDKENTVTQTETITQPQQQPVISEAPSKGSSSSTAKTTTNKSSSQASTPAQNIASQQQTAPVVEPLAETNAKSSVRDADYDAGMRHYKAAEGWEAVQAFKASGSKESLRMLGKIYEEGCGSIEPNAMMSRKYYKEAEKK